MLDFISSLCGILCLFCILAAPIALIVWIILSIAKNKRKKQAKKIFFGSLIGIVLFTAIGVATFQECEHNWETLVKVPATCTENGSSVRICTLCDEEESGEEIAALGHKWKETVQEATCTEQGNLTRECTVCGEVAIEILSPHHNYTETVVVEPKCETDGKALLLCSVCGDSQESAIPATGHTWGDEKIIDEPKCELEGKLRLTCSVCGTKENRPIAATGHTWVGATCTTAKMCSSCKLKEGEPIGHTTDAGVCSRCQETVMKQSPVTVIGMRYTIDYAGGVEWTFKIRNNSDKEIKYITFQWSCYNAVGDPIRDEITGKSYVRLKFTGPLAPGKTTGKKRNTTLFYNYSFDNLKWNEITIEYMDGTTESITEYYEGYYQK